MLRKTALACLGTLAAVALTASQTAHAGIISGSFAVTDWTGPGITDTASSGSQPTGPATASFTYTGPIDFVNNNGQGGSNTFGDFFGTNSSGISGLSPIALAAFLGTTMSTPGFAVNSYMQFVSTSPFNVPTGTTASLSHDDGASLYSGGTTVTTSPSPTTETTDTGSLPSGSANLTLVYVEANGSPADLTLTTSNPVTQVPEPGSLALLGTGLVMTGLLTQRRRRRCGKAPGAALA